MNPQGSETQPHTVQDQVMHIESARPESYYKEDRVMSERPVAKVEEPKVFAGEAETRVEQAEKQPQDELSFAEEVEINDLLEASDGNPTVFQESMLAIYEIVDRLPDDHPNKKGADEHVMSYLRDIQNIERKPVFAGKFIQLLGKIYGRHEGDEQLKDYIDVLKEESGRVLRAKYRKLDYGPATVQHRETEPVKSEQPQQQVEAEGENETEEVISAEGSHEVSTQEAFRAGIEEIKKNAGHEEELHQNEEVVKEAVEPESPEATDNAGNGVEQQEDEVSPELLEEAEKTVSLLEQLNPKTQAVVRELATKTGMQLPESGQNGRDWLKNATEAAEKIEEMKKAA